MTTHDSEQTIIHDIQHVLDPVCGMKVAITAPAATLLHEGITYLFCSTHCLDKFKASPDSYSGAGLTKPEQTISLAGESDLKSNIFTCPMHPEIQQEGPGPCPKCGMALEPRTVAVDEGENPELVDMIRRFYLSLILTIPEFIIAMGHMLPGHPLAALASPRTYGWIELLLASPVVLWAGWPFFVRGWQSLVNRSLNMFTLISLGVGVAYGYSTVATLFRTCSLHQRKCYTWC